VIIPFNKVLIKPDADYESAHGLTMVGPEQHHMSIYGTVVVPPDRLLSFGDKIRKAKKHGYEKYHARFLNSITSHIGGPVEIKTGDRVLYNYMAKIKDGRIGDNLLFDYSLLLFNITQQKALNGLVFLEVEEKGRYEDIDGLTIENFDIRRHGFATVRYVGGKTIHRDFEDYEPDIAPGDRVMYDKRFAARIEMDIHNSLTEGTTSLMKTMKRAILCKLIH